MCLLWCSPRVAAGLGLRFSSFFFLYKFGGSFFLALDGFRFRQCLSCFSFCLSMLSYQFLARLVVASSCGLAWGLGWYVLVSPITLLFTLTCLLVATCLMMPFLHDNNWKNMWAHSVWVYAGSIVWQPKRYHRLIDTVRKKGQRSTLAKNCPSGCGVEMSRLR